MLHTQVQLVPPPTFSHTKHRDKDAAWKQQSAWHKKEKLNRANLTEWSSLKLTFQSRGCCFQVSRVLRRRRRLSLTACRCTQSLASYMDSQSSQTQTDFVVLLSSSQSGSHLNGFISGNVDKRCWLLCAALCRCVIRYSSTIHLPYILFHTQ